MTDARKNRAASGAAATTKELERGRGAYGRRAWADAYTSLTRADRVAALQADDLERLAWSAGLIGRDDEMLKAMERLYQARLDAGDRMAAARCAFWLAFRLFGLREAGRAGGWLGRAQRIIGEHGRDCVERGYLLLPLVYRHLASDAAEAASLAASAVEIGERFDDRSLTAFARCLHGRALLGLGRYQEGLALLDGAMVDAATGELSPIFTGLIYCSAIDWCQRVCALDRAREWTALLAAWCEAQPQLVTFTGECRAHRSAILQLHGDWRGAMSEAQRASRPDEPAGDHEGMAAGYYQEAEIHRLRGELVEAEEDYRRASKYGRDPQPGLALLRVAQGKQKAAAAAIQRVMDASKGPLQRTRLLPAYVEIMLSVADLDAARSGRRELEQLAENLESEIIAAMAAHAAGALLLAEGDARAALGPLRRAFAAWQQVEAPYLAARLRVLIGAACRALGDDDGAELEWDAARGVFEELGAAPDLHSLEARSARRAAARPHGLTSRELEVLRLVAAGHTNKVIAATLFVSEKTVDRHVSNIFNKIGVSSRAAATAYAYEHKLL